MSDSAIAASENLSDSQVSNVIDGVLRQLGLRQRIELFFYAATKEGQEQLQAPPVRKAPAGVVVKKQRKSN